ncbi:Hypp4603 [Branchiostoma lanceolatum]|uniref:Hypp4603 protein n=1 Tax=Branchiostoma lanceolatum TaxID=7740 RepID=A0A8K0EYI5_BRALA|nr:Hypp4603 [Branchiostoma lanceolatum]
MAEKKFLAVLLCAAILVTVCQAQDETCDSCAVMRRANAQYKTHEEQFRDHFKWTDGLEREAVTLEQRVAELEAAAKK